MRIDYQPKTLNQTATHNGVRSGLCKTNKYIIAGDYFLASINQKNTCIVYFNNKENLTKNDLTIGLMNSNNYVQTTIQDYNDVLSSWQTKYYAIIKTISIDNIDNKALLVGESTVSETEKKHYADGQLL